VTVGALALSLIGVVTQAQAATTPAFTYTPSAGPIGTAISISNGGCASAQVGGDAIALYRAADGAVVDFQVQLGNDPTNRRPWSTTLIVKPTLGTSSGVTQATTPGSYVLSLFCDIGSSWRPPSDPSAPSGPAQATLNKPFTVTGGAVDTTPPNTTISSGPAQDAWLLRTSTSFSFTSTETGSTFGCTVDAKTLPCTPPPATLSSLTQRSHLFSVSAHDTAGNIDTTPAARVFTVPRNNTTLTHSTGWVKATGTGYYLNSYSQTTTRGASLRLAVSGARRLALVATRGPGHGTVRVFLGSTLLRSISLAATTLRKRQLIGITTFAAATTGTIRVVSATGGKPVRIEGLGVATR
jgi:hypothetical protein